MKLTFSPNRLRFELETPTTEDSKLAESCGFRLDGRLFRWFTMSAELARSFEAVADDAAKFRIRQHRSIILQSHASSVSSVRIPAPNGLEYLPFQIGGIAYAMNRQNCLNADEPGLGKTIQGIGVINACQWITNVLVVCPAVIKMDWLMELRKWLVRPLSAEVLYSPDPFPTSQIVIINYDILMKYRAEIDKRQWDLLIADECQMIKESTAKRTRAVFGYRSAGNKKSLAPIAVRQRLFLTGTPMVNQPEDLWQLCTACDPDDLGKSWQYFAKRYCRLWKAPWGWDSSGAANLEELQGRLRGSFMIRRLKKDVQSELPPKRRQIVILPITGIEALLDEEKKAFAASRQKIELEVEKADQEIRESEQQGKDDYKKRSKKLGVPEGTAFELLAKLRHDVAVAKIPYAVEFLKLKLQEHNKVVVFAHHRDVIDGVRVAMGKYGVDVITGDMDAEEKYRIKQKFQEDSKCRVLILSITIAVGLTLTAASYGIAIELDWRPSVMTQCEDRLHRIGQTESVLIQHLVFDMSLDATQVKRIIQKQETIDKAINYISTTSV